MSLLRALATVSGVTALSRILGFIRDILMGYFLGSSHAADAFFAAFKLFIGIKVDEKKIDDFKNVLLLIIFNNLSITKIFC